MFLSVSQAQEQHIHNKTKDEWGGNIGNAIVGGAITGLASGLGSNSETFFVNKFGESVISAALTAGTISYSVGVGNNMSTIALNGGSLGDVLESGVESLTSKDVLRNSITSGLVSGLIVGLGDKLNNIVSTKNEIITAIKESISSSLINTAIENTINGGSFEEMFKDQLITSLVMAGGNLATKEIGKAVHETVDVDINGNLFYNEPSINKTTQLLLHGIVGATVSGLTGNDMLSGAVSGVVGEITGDILRNNGFNKEDGSNIAGLTGSISSLITGKLQGLEDNEIVSNIFTGQRLGKNASENNAYFMKRPLEGSKWLNSLSHSEENSYRNKKNIEYSHEHIFFEDEEGGNIGFFNDNKVRSDKEELLNTYRDINDNHYDDSILRKAIDNVIPKEYKLFDQSRITGIGTDTQYNCQDWAEEVRQEYYKLINTNNLKSEININNNEKSIISISD